MTNLDLSAIKIIGFDVDGVMTDGGIIINDDGSESKSFNSRDGFALKLLTRFGYEVAIITGRKSRVVELRAQELGIEEIHQKAIDKWPVFEAILARKGLKPQEAAFCGDDLIDLPILSRVGLAMAPVDAAPEVKAVCHFVSSNPGGHGAVREMVEFVLKSQGRWPEVMARYSE